MLDLLAPQRCGACDALYPGSSGYCDECGIPSPLLDISCHIDGAPVFAGARYGEPIASSIQRFKYEHAPELSRVLASSAVRGIELLGIEASDVWVPVPLHPLRLAERGYNQSALLACELARHAHGSVDARRLRRLRNTEQQAKQSRLERSQNVANAFAARPRTPTRRVVLVDDVVTTGATLRACIAALRAAGDEVVGCVAVAYADSSSM